MTRINKMLRLILPPNLTLVKNQNEQEIRSVERGYLSHCFKSRTRDLDHAPFGVIYRPLCSTSHGLSNKEKNEESTFIHLKVMESEVPKFKK